MSQCNNVLNSASTGLRAERQEREQPKSGLGLGDMIYPCQQESCSRQYQDMGLHTGAHILNQACRHGEAGP
jgi:hypothetical protein